MMPESGVPWVCQSDRHRGRSVGLRALALIDLPKVVTSPRYGRWSTCAVAT
jgi:hypothetical protein